MEGIPQMTVSDQIKLCKSLAKSEALSLQENEDSLETYKELELNVAALMDTPLNFSNGKGGLELFTIFLYMYSQSQSQDPAQGYLALTFELLKKAQLHIAQRRHVFQNDEANQVNIEIDISLKSDKQLNSLLEVTAVILKKLLGYGEIGVFSLLERVEGMLTQYLQDSVQQFRLDVFAPTAIVYKLLEYLIKDSRLNCTNGVLQRLDQVLALTFKIFEQYKVNSKYFIMTIHSSGQTAQKEEKSVRRMSVLFTDLLDLLVGFCCQYLKTLARMGSSTYTAQAIKLYQALFSGSANEDEYFTLRERLRILNELNAIFIGVPELSLTPYYWGMLREGLYDLDQYCRKVAMSVLKGNLKQLASDTLYQGFVTKAEFENLWTTFFDLYDTLESFGSHLTKAVWERSETFFEFIQKHYPCKMHPLLDFREWLLVLYRRVQSHMNLKLRRYVQKSTLKRKYMTTHLEEYTFDGLLISLNKGLIFKDMNIYTQFSLKNEMVNKFYERYFATECKDLARDLSILFRGFVRHVSHPQLLLCTLKNLARDYPTSRKQLGSGEYIGNHEVQLLHDMTSSYFSDQYFSAKYLCWKYILQMLSLYTKTNEELNPSLFLKLLGKMPIEFFSNQTRYSDHEGWKAAKLFCLTRLPGGIPMIQTYLNDLFQVKALVSQMPSFGNDVDTVIEGITRVILILSMPEEEGQMGKHGQHEWLREIMRPNWEAFQQIMSSSYLSPEVLDSKVRYLSVFLRNLYRYGDDSLRATLRQDFIPHTLHLVLERLDANLLLPVSQHETALQPSEMNRVYSLFNNYKYYLRFLGLSVEACHIHMNQQNSAVEKIIKTYLQMGLKVSQAAQAGGTSTWGVFLMQQVTNKGLREITKIYAKGIKQCLAKGITYFMVAEDIFTFGRPLLQASAELRQITRPKESEDQVTAEQKRFLIDNGLSLTLMAQDSLLSQWKILSQLIQIFQYERQLREELLVPLYPVIADQAADFLSRATKPYNSALFRVLKNTYIPVVLQRLSLSDGHEQVITDYQNVCYQCWGIIKELQTEFDVSTLQEFFEFAFSSELMDKYASDPILMEISDDFHRKMAAEIFEQGNKYWLIMRTAMNHILTIIVNKPHLLKGFEDYIVNFAICREARSLDAEILLYKLRNLIPQIFTKDYEDLNLEEITYQGGYIRAMSLIAVESMVNQHKRALKSGQPLTKQMLDFSEGMEKVIILLLEVNYDKRFDKAAMPYSDSHRTKVRAWQSLVVALEHLEPNESYIPAFRQAVIANNGGRDVIAEVNNHLWKCIAMNHLPSVRGYIEIVVIRYSLYYPQISVADQQFVKTLLDPNIKSTVASSHLMIAGFVLAKLTGNDSEVLRLRTRLMEHLSAFLTSNGAHVRCIAQYFITVIARDPQMKAFIPQGMQPIVEFLLRNRDCDKVFKRFEKEILRMERVVTALSGVEIVLSTPIDIYGEFLSQPFVEKIKEVTSEVMSLIRNHSDEITPIKKENLWKEELEIRKAEGAFNLEVSETATTNYQRKILPWDLVEHDHELLKRVYESRTRNDIIMCAALIDKIPNLAGLARTSEIMNAQCLVINNRAVCDTDEFKGVSVTSEKWLPMIEVQEKDLYNYLLYQKTNGYKILGLEQTACSKMLNDYQFPSKCVMLLGKEKEGIPQEYLSILDECIEIPQFGIIRSLNVHVSGALCLWEYTKQHLPNTNSSQRT